MSSASDSTVQGKLWKAISLPLLLFIFLSGVLIVWLQSSNLKEHFEQINIHLVQQSANASEYALLLNDTTLIAANVQELLRKDDIVGVTFYDANKQIVDQAGQSLPLKAFSSSVETHYTDSDYYTVSAPIVYQADNALTSSTISSGNGATSVLLADAMNMQSNLEAYDLIGWLSITVSTKGLTLDIINVSAITCLFCLLSALLGLGLSWLIIKKVAAPYQRLVNSLSDIANGNYRQAQGLELPTFLNHTSEELRYIAGRLENYRTELENEIELITKETRQNAVQLEEQSAQLYIANKEANESNRLKTQFLANISHEVRTPLNAILGYTQLLQKDDLKNQQKTYVDTIEKSTHNLLATIGDILDFSKIESGKLVLESSDFNLRDLIEEVFHTLASTLLDNDKDLNLIPNFARDLPEWVKGDAIRIRQILTNLVGNAIKFTQVGSVEVIASTVSCNAQQLTIQIQVKDTGIGIPKNKLNQLFKPFSQVDPSSSRNYSGTGLGLVITKKLIEQMNGDIKVDSEQSRGSNFHFTVQLRPSDKANDPYEPKALRLIALETNKQYRDYLKSFLGTFVEHYELTSSFEHFIQILHSDPHSYDVALLQVDNTQQSMEETYQLIEYLDNRFGIPSILMTRPTSYIGPHANIYHLAKDVLFKPVSPKKLHQALSELVQSPSEESSISSQQPTTIITTNKPLHILAVDDTPVNLQLLGHWLKPHNIELSLANSGMQAIKMASERLFDLVLMDIQMPQMDGMEATRKLRGLEHYQDIPIIALTAHALEEEKRSMLASGMNAYLTKPVNEDILLNTINEWCTKSQSLSTLIDDEVRQIFDVEKALTMTSQNVTAAQEIFTMFMDTLKQDKRLLPHQFANQELDKLIATVHRIHGASKYTGCIEVIQHANYLETHLKELGFDEVEEIYQDFMEAIERLESIESIIPWTQVSQMPEQKPAHPTS